MQSTGIKEIKRQRLSGGHIFLRHNLQNCTILSFFVILYIFCKGGGRGSGKTCAVGLFCWQPLSHIIPTLDMKRVHPQAALSMVSSCSSRVDVLGRL